MDYYYDYDYNTGLIYQILDYDDYDYDSHVFSGASTYQVWIQRHCYPEDFALCYHPGGARRDRGRKKKIGCGGFKQPLGRMRVDGGR